MKKINILRTENIPSTNAALKSLAADGAPEGILLISDMQSGGYGRLSRAFFSPKGTGLYMSLLVRPSFPIAHATALTPLAAVACAQAAEEIAAVSVGIKWVNDILVADKKAAGILVEASPDKEYKRLSYAVIGVGVNLFPPDGGFPPGIEKTAAALFPAQRRAEFSRLRDALALRFTEIFSAYYDELPHVSFLSAYRERSLLIGKRITVYDAVTDREKKGVGKNALVLGITDDFGLAVKYEDGREEILKTGEVTLGY